MKRALLWLAFALTLSASLEGKEPPLSAEARDCFKWFEGLGYPDVKEAP